jgi:hypothetical protein
VGILGEMATRMSFASRGSERREWRSGLTRTSTTRSQVPRAKASVRTFPAWGERKAVGGAAGRATPVRSVRGTSQTGAGLDR